MAFNPKALEAEMFRKGYRTKREFQEAYDNKYGRMTEATFYNKMGGDSDWTRKEISNIMEILNIGRDTMQKIFFCNDNTV